jgi:FixJ family two-component response regulator
MSLDGPVFIVDDDAAARSSLRALVEANGFRVHPYASAAEFLDHYLPGTPGCLITDLQMPDMDGLQLQQVLGSQDSLPIIFITGFGDVPNAVTAIKSGAVDFLEKPFDDTILIETIKYALSLAERAQRKDDAREFAARLPQLSPRELQVLRYLLGGHSNKSIAQRILISPRTVEIHRGNLMRKLSVQDLPRLVRFAVAAGVKPIEDAD